MVNVTNNNMQDVEVFLNQSKFVQRLGSVGTGQVGTLEIPVRELKNKNDITLTVKLVGIAPSTGSYVTQPLLVHPGDEFNLTVAPVLEHSRLSKVGHPNLPVSQPGLIFSIASTRDGRCAVGSVPFRS